MNDSYVPRGNPERFSTAWRHRIDIDYRRGDITEERWRDLIAAWELNGSLEDRERCPCLVCKTVRDAITGQIHSDEVPA